MQVVLQHTEAGSDVFHVMASGETDADGRCSTLLPPRGSGDNTELVHGKTYKMVFKTKDYFVSSERKCFYPWVEIIFEIENPKEHYHIPLLISPYSYTTYRGS